MNVRIELHFMAALAGLGPSMACPPEVKEAKEKATSLALVVLLERVA
jgi:hypothetical protein